MIKQPSPRAVEHAAPSRSVTLQCPECGLGITCVNEVTASGQGTVSATPGEDSITTTVAQPEQVRLQGLCDDGHMLELDLRPHEGAVLSVLCTCGGPAVGDLTKEVYKEVFEPCCVACFGGELCEDCEEAQAGALIWGFGEENTFLCDACWDARIGEPETAGTS